MTYFFFAFLIFPSFCFALSSSSQIDSVKELYLQIREHSLIKHEACLLHSYSLSHRKKFIQAEQKHPVKFQVNNGLVCFMIDDAKDNLKHPNPSFEQINSYRLKQAKKLLLELEQFEQRYSSRPFCLTPLYSYSFLRDFDPIVEQLKLRIQTFSKYRSYQGLSLCPLEEHVDLYFQIIHTLVPACLFFSKLAFLKETTPINEKRLNSSSDLPATISCKDIFDTVFQPLTLFLSQHPLFIEEVFVHFDASELVVRPHSLIPAIPHIYPSHYSPQIISHSQISPLLQFNSPLPPQLPTAPSYRVNFISYLYLHGCTDFAIGSSNRRFCYYTHYELQNPYSQKQELSYYEELHDFVFCLSHFIRAHNIQPRCITLSPCRLSQQDLGFVSNLELMTYWFSLLLPFQPHPLEIRCISPPHSSVSCSKHQRCFFVNISSHAEKYLTSFSFLTPTHKQSFFSFDSSGTIYLPINLLARLFIFPHQLQGNLNNSQWIRSPFLSLISTTQPFIQKLTVNIYTSIIYQNILPENQSFNLFQTLSNHVLPGFYFILVNPFKTMVIRTTFMPWLHLNIESIYVESKQEIFPHFNDDDLRYLLEHIDQLLHIPLSAFNIDEDLRSHLKPYRKIKDFLSISPSLRIFSHFNNRFICDLLAYENFMKNFSSSFPYQHISESHFSIHKACAFGQLDIVQFLTCSSPEHLTSLDKNKNTPLMVALKNNQHAIVHYLTLTSA